MNSFFTSEKIWLDKWDVFIRTNIRGVYAQYPDWCNSYKEFGFDNEVFVMEENSSIKCGCIIVYAEILGFNFAVVPVGPIITSGNEHLLQGILLKLIERAQQKKSCVFQVTIPYQLRLNQNFSLLKFKSIEPTLGIAFKPIGPIMGYRLIDLKGKRIEEIHQLFSKNLKRNLKKSLNSNLEIRFLNKETDIREAYKCFEKNGNDKGYSLRPFNSLKKYFLKTISEGKTIIIGAFLDDKLIGSLYLVKTDNMMSYINGGVIKEYQSLQVSVFMHFSMIQYAIDKKIRYYDFCIGGTEGVLRFKKSFGTEKVENYPTLYWVLKKRRFYLFKFVEKYFKGYKKNIAKLLMKFRK
ncbi:MAG: peptidoglycan bridge formation glycyltransferase FemA/FemB family protein [Flavobacteriales bacterium]|nr:peptidoglycan bridge formation glycyltransferase FemA/FemB family protein [Flavobacteriales bacterium]